MTPKKDGPREHAGLCGFCAEPVVWQVCLDGSRWMVDARDLRPHTCAHMRSGRRRPRPRKEHGDGQ